MPYIVTGKTSGCGRGVWPGCLFRFAREKSVAVPCNPPRTPPATWLGWVYHNHNIDHNLPSPRVYTASLPTYLFALKSEDTIYYLCWQL